MPLLNLGSGLSELGSGVAKLGGAMALEQQKSMLNEQSMKLADELTTAREHTGRMETADIAQAAQGREFGQQSTLEGVRQTGEGTRNTERIAGEKERTILQEKGANERNAATVNAPPPDVKLAEWYAGATKAQRRAYQEGLLAKAGVPPSLLGQDIEDGPTPPKSTAKPDATLPSENKPGAPSVKPGEEPAPIKEGALPEGAAPALDPKIKDAKLPFSSIKYNEEALKGLGAGDVAIVKQMVEGRMAPPTSFAMAKPIWRAYIAKANEYDPSFDATTWASRVSTRKSFASGPDAANVNSMNTALGHAERLYDNFKTLDNFGGAATLLNTPYNAVRTAMGSNAVTNVQTDINILASEARKVFAGTGGGGLEELRNWEKSFPVNGSPEQQRGALEEFSHLLGSRLDEMANKYNRGMSTSEQPMQLLNPRAQAAFKKISGEEPPAAVGLQLGNNTPGTPKPETPAASVPAPAQRELNKQYDLPGGKTGTWTADGWVDVK